MKIYRAELVKAGHCASKHLASAFNGFKYENQTIVDPRRSTITALPSNNLTSKSLSAFRNF
jgi:hypothetical protein